MSQGVFSEGACMRNWKMIVPAVAVALGVVTPAEAGSGVCNVYLPSKTCQASKAAIVAGPGTYIAGSNQTSAQASYCPGSYYRARATCISTATGFTAYFYSAW